MDLFERILDEAIKNPKKEPLSNYGLHPFEMKSSAELEKYFVNYEKELKELVNQILPSPAEKPTVKIAIIGPSGSGKTTLLRYLFFKINQLREDPKYKDAIGNINTLPPLFPKGLPNDIIKIVLDSFKKSKGALMVIDDLHEIFIEENPHVSQSYFDILKSDSKNNVVITTWLPNGWSYSLSKHPEIKNMFDKVIFVKGLSEENCKKFVEKRFRCCSDHNEGLDSHQEVSYKPFAKGSIDRIIKVGCPNPAIILNLIERTVKYAYDRGLKEITEKEVNELSALLGYEMKLEQLTPTQRQILQLCLISTTLSIKQLTNITGMERPNVSKYTNELKDLGILERIEVEKEALFRIVPFVRYSIENETMKEVELSSQKV